MESINTYYIEYDCHSATLTFGLGHLVIMISTSFVHMAEEWSVCLPYSKSSVFRWSLHVCVLQMRTSCRKSCCCGNLNSNQRPLSSTDWKKICENHSRTVFLFLLPWIHFSKSVVEIPCGNCWPLLLNLAPCCDRPLLTVWTQKIPLCCRNQVFFPPTANRNRTTLLAGCLEALFLMALLPQQHLHSN